MFVQTTRIQSPSTYVEASHSLGCFESQSGFTLGRLIIDNVFVANEQFHYLPKKKKWKFINFALKLDMGKWYGRVEWCFLQQMKRKLDFLGFFGDIVLLLFRTRILSLLHY